jgi:hypothetical protein
MFENMKKPTKRSFKMDKNLALLSQEDNSRSCKMNDIWKNGLYFLG